MNEKYGEGTVEVVLNDQYYNMKEKIDPNMHVIDIVLQAMMQSGVSPKVSTSETPMMVRDTSDCRRMAV